jgi:predicted DNA-binding transcriptional regulator AlpA
VGVSSPDTLFDARATALQAADDYAQQPIRPNLPAVLYGESPMPPAILSPPAVTTPPPDWLDPSEAGTYLGRSTQTLWRWRARGEGPPYHRLVGRIRYRQADVDRWLADRCFTGEPSE